MSEGGSAAADSLIPPPPFASRPRQINWVNVTTYDCGGVNLPRPEADPRCTPVPPGGLQARLRLQENTQDWPWEAIVLLGWLVAFRVAVYVALRKKTASKGTA